MSDYNQTVTIVSFEAGSYVAMVDIPIINDNIGELEEVFYGMLSIVGSSNVKIIQDEAEIYIIDDDGKHYTPLNDGIIKSFINSSCVV